MNIQDQVKPGRIGWFAIRHKDGWWVGTDKGVTCYADRKLARYALTLVWQRDGGGVLNYRVRKYTGATVPAGEHTPIKSAEQALKDYAKELMPVGPSRTQQRRLNRRNRA